MIFFKEEAISKVKDTLSGIIDKNGKCKKSELVESLELNKVEEEVLFSLLKTDHFSDFVSVRGKGGGIKRRDAVENKAQSKDGTTEKVAKAVAEGVKDDGLDDEIALEVV